MENSQPRLDLPLGWRSRILHTFTCAIYIPPKYLWSPVLLPYVDDADARAKWMKGKNVIFWNGLHVYNVMYGYNAAIIHISKWRKFIMSLYALMKYIMYYNNTNVPSYTGCSHEITIIQTSPPTLVSLMKLQQYKRALLHWLLSWNYNNTNVPSHTGFPNEITTIQACPPTLVALKKYRMKLQ